MTLHAPLAVLGLFLIGAFSILFVHIQFKMRQIGVKTYPLFARPADWGLPAKYLKVRSQQGWSPWPVYLMWPCLLIGIISLVLGMYQLQK